MYSPDQRPVMRKAFPSHDVIMERIQIIIRLSDSADTAFSHHLPLSRLLHSPSLVALVLSVGYETSPPVVLLRLVGLNRGWDCISRSGLRAHMTDENFHRFSEPLIIPSHSCNRKHLSAVGAVQRWLWKSLVLEISVKCFDLDAIITQPECLQIRGNPK